MLYLKNGVKSKKDQIRRKKRQYSLNPKKLPALLLTAIAEVGIISIDMLFNNRPQLKIYNDVFESCSSQSLTRKKVSTYLWNLKKQGLVHIKERKWSATSIGKSLVESIKQRRFISINPNVIPQKDGVPRVVVFDIPETERRKRDWIRLELINCDYKPLQKSVWLGFRPLPQEFIEELEFLKIEKYVHIFTINKTGTIYGFL